MWFLRRFALALAAGMAGLGAQAQTVIAWGTGFGTAKTVPTAALHAVAVSAGSSHNLAVLANGSVVAWGTSTWGEIRVPTAATNIIAVAAGTTHSLALRRDGAVIAWGGSNAGLTNVPGSATNIIAIAAAVNHSLALRDDGTVVSWGLDSNPSYAMVPESATNAVRIATGPDLSMAFRRDGTVVVWRSQSMRLLAIPDSGRPTIAAGGSAQNLFVLDRVGNVHSYRRSLRGAPATNIVAISTFDENLLALCADGTMLAWRGSSWGQGMTNLPVGVVRVRAVSAGKEHGLAIVDDGRPRLLQPIQSADWVSAGNNLPLGAFAVGDGPLSYQWLADGFPIPGATNAVPSIPAQLGNDSTEYRVAVSNLLGSVVSEPAKFRVKCIHAWGRNAVGQIDIPSQLTDPIMIAAGAYHSVALESDGSVVTWGKNVNHTADLPAEAQSGVVSVAAGAAHSLALKADGTIVGWGPGNGFGEATPPLDATNVVAISAGWGHSLALRADGTLAAWGYNEYGQGTVSFLATEVTAIASGYFHNLALRTDGTVVGWGLEADAPASATNVTAIAAGYRHSLALRADGVVLAWGDDYFGQSSVPAAASNVVAIAAGFYHSMALRSDGTVVAWGRSVHGITEYPKQLARIRSIAAGEDHSIAIVDTGRVRFGRGLERVVTFAGGPLVITSQAQAPPGATFQWLRDGIPVPGATKPALLIPHASALDAGYYELAVVTDDGEVRGPSTELRVNFGPGASSGVGAWGDDRNGQCLLPVALKNPVAIAAGGFHALALQPDGTVIAWGKGRGGQTNVPPEATNVTAIAAGGDHSLALRQDGSVVAWGRNWDGQASPPGSARNVRAISAGWAHSVALRRDGSLVAWGNNDYGQLDIPADATNLIAVASGHYHNLALRADGRLIAWGWDDEIPAAASNVVAMAAGWGHSLAVRADGAVIAWGENGSGQCDVPAEATNVIAVAAGFYHSMALRGDGTVLAWGLNFQGVTRVPAQLRFATAIAAGEDFSLALTQSGAPRIESMTPPALTHVGGRVLLNGQVTGSYPFQFQWLLDGKELAGQTNRILSLNVLTSAQAGNYSLRVVSPVGAAMSPVVQVQTEPAPRVSGRPVHLVRLPHTPVCLTADVEGEAPLTLQWLLDGQPIPDRPGVSGSQSRTLCLEDPVAAMSGEYSMVVRNAQGVSSGLVAVVSISPVIAWGNQDDGRLMVPPTKVAPVALAAGSAHSLALLADGTVSAWGDNSLGQCNVPFDLQNAVAISAGESHSLALLSDGTARAWGDNTFGQGVIPAEATNLVAVGAGGDNSVVLRADGVAVGWGARFPGVRTSPAELGPIVNILAGKVEVFLVQENGSLFAWTYAVLPPSNHTAKVISMGDRHYVQLMSDGSIRTQGATPAVAVPPVPEAATNAVMVAAGGNGSLALRQDGTVVAWGDASMNQLVVPDKVRDIVAIARGSSHSLALRSYVDSPIPVTSDHETVFEGMPASFSARPAAAPFPAYQWSHNGIAIPGATNASWLIESVQWPDRGSYELTGTWPFGTVRSGAIPLRVRRFAFRLEGEQVTGNTAERVGAVTVGLDNPFPGGRAVYTTDGSDPAVQGIPYGGPFLVARSAELRCQFEDASASERVPGESLLLLLSPDVHLTLGSPGGGRVVSEPPGPFLPRGGSVTLTAQADPGWTFLQWTGDAVGNDPVVHVTLDRSKNIQAVFGAPVGIETVGDGTVIVAPSLPFHPFGSRPAFTASPAAGNSFARWEGALGGSISSGTVLVTAPGLVVRATFDPMPGERYALVTSAQGRGMIQASRFENRYDLGREIMLTPVPEAGHQFLQWSGDATGTNAPLRVIMDRSKSITAIFSRDVQLQLGNTTGSGGTARFGFKILGAPGEVYEIQRSATMEAWSASGVLTNWTGQAGYLEPIAAPGAGYFRVRVLP